MFFYQSDYKILICEQHGYAIRNLETHLQREHHLSHIERKSIVQQYQSKNLLLPNLVQWPDNGLSPIRGLTIHNGFQCIECGFLCPHRNQIRSHCNKAHNWRITRQNPKHWQQVKLQTFFNGCGLTKYFVVMDPDLEKTDIDQREVRDLKEEDMIKRLLEEGLRLDQEEESRLERAEENPLNTDNTPWLRRTG